MKSAKFVVAFSIVFPFLSVLLLPGCGGSNSDDAPTPGGKDKIVLMLNWYPEAEHGGFYAAQTNGIFEKYGLEVEIRAGGPSAPVAQELVAGRVQFAIGNADDVLVFREQDVPVVALMAPIQNTPRCILVHEESGVTDLNGLSGLTMQAGAGRPYLKFMESKGMLEGVTLVPYSGVSNFVTDKKNAMQGYSFSEPLVAKQLEANARVMMVSDIGFNPYASCLIATDDYIAENRDLVGRMVVACREGWRAYFEDSALANAKILEENGHGMTAEALEFGTSELRPLCITDTVPISEICKMESSRWEELTQQFVDLKLVDPSKVKASDVFSVEYLDRVGATESSAGIAE